jgi:uncharacterized membrane protein
MVLENSFINDVTMFFLGAIIGTILHWIFEFIVKTYNIHSHQLLLIIGIIQLLMIALITRLLTSTLSIQGLFILGIISSQELIITRVYPRMQQIQNKN